MNRFLLFFLLLIPGFSVKAQLDTAHWLPPLHSRAENQIQDHYVYLSTPVLTPFTVTIRNGSGTVLATPVISAGNPYVYSVGTGENPATPLFVPIDSLNLPIRNCGLTLTAPQPFYANQRMRSNAQAESVTSKGTAAKGTVFRVGGFPQFYDGGTGDRSFTAGIMATANNTVVTISDYTAGVIFAGVPSVSSPTMTVTLQAGECYVVSGYTNTAANLDGFVGALIQSTQPIVLSNGNILGNIHPTSNSRDMGVDQSVPVTRLGTEHILVEGNGIADMEEPIVIAHFPNTEIFVNGGTVPIATIQPGDYYIVPNSNYQGTTHRNMYLKTSQPAYVYQALAGSSSQATSGLNFIPPFNCFLQHSIDFIPLVEQIGSTIYTGGIMLFTQQGATLQINGVTQTGAVPVAGVPWETYKVTGLTGNISINSSAAVAAGIFGTSNSAGFAGYFSGFSSNPSASDFTYADTCITSVAQFTGSYDINVAIDSVSWSFDDPASGANQSSSLNPTHSFSAPGTYDVRFIVFRCENDTVVKTITILGEPTPATVGPDQTICSAAATLSGNTITTGTGTWTLVSGSGTIALPNNPASTVSGLGVGPNTFQWTSSNGSCASASATLVITRNPVPTTADAGPDQSVCSDQATLGGNAPATGTGTWTLISGTGAISDPSVANPSITGLSNGANVFQWTIANAPCPSSSDQVTITRVGPPTTSAAGTDQTVCSDQATLSGNTAVSGTGTWTVVSGSGAFSDPSAANATVTGLSVGTNVFAWTIANSPCASSSDQVTITRVGPPTTAAAGTDQTVCSDQATLSGNTAVSGTGTWTVVSGSGTFSDPSAANATVTALGVGTNVFAWTIANSPCASSSDQVTIVRVAPPSAAAAGTDQTICASQGQLAATAPASGTGSWSLISGSGTITDPALNNTTVTGLGVGQNVFQWTVTSTPCPASSDQVMIQISDPVMSVQAVTPDYCDQGNGTASVTITGTSGTVNYVWTPGNLTGPSQTGLDAGTYTVAAVDGSNCSAQVQVVIAAAPGTQVEAGADVSVCSGQTVTLTASGSANYVWSPAATNGVSFVPAASGIYTVTATDANGCPSTDFLTVTVIPGPSAGFTIISSPTLMNTSVSLVNTSLNGTSYTWDFGNGGGQQTTTPDIVTTSYSSPGSYEIVLTVSDQQCSDDAVQTIIVLPYPDPVIEFPNVFTPNGDNLNDLFELSGQYVQSLEIVVVNRWGNKVAELDTQHPSWTGGDCVDGVYFYTYKVTGLNGKELTGQGNVTLIR